MKMKKAACLVLLLIACSATTEVALGGDPKGKPPHHLSRWEGIWLLDCKYEKSTTSVIAILGPSNIMSFFFREGDGQCTLGSDAPQSRVAFLEVSILPAIPLVFKHHLKGKIHFCTDDKTLADAKKLTAVFDCDFEGDLDDATDTIDGDAKGEYWSWPKDHPEQATRDPSQDPKIHVNLRLKRGKGAQPQAPPDTNPYPTPTADPLAGITRVRSAIVDATYQGVKRIGQD